ncbi:hypothetical protein HYU11_01425 [Candidatus Woesearchaeota archaeon]|nr:hypothetical protein [Candidatus Woesearchaeota archaeon]
MAQDILDEIKKAEKEAEDMLRTAEKRKTEIVEDAKITCHKIINMRDKEIQDYHEKVMSEGMEKIRLAKEKIKEAGKSEIKEIEKKASRRKEKAIETIISYFEEAIK